MMLNGRLDAGLLVALGTDAYGRPILLRADAAASLLRVSAASGIALGPQSISDSYRDYARQVEYEQDPPNSVGLASTAGKSSHGWARAIDARGRLLTWLTKHGAEYGWVRTIRPESWHYEHFAALDQHADGMQLTALPDPLTPVAPEEDAMYLIHHTNGAEQAYYVTDGARFALVAAYPQNPDLAIFQSVMRTVEAVGPNGRDPWIRISEQLGAQTPVDAREIAAALVPLIIGHLGSVPTTDAQTLAKAVADELARRIAG